MHAEQLLGCLADARDHSWSKLQLCRMRRLEYHPPHGSRRNTLASAGGRGLLIVYFRCTSKFALVHLDECSFARFLDRRRGQRSSRNSSHRHPCLYLRNSHLPASQSFCSYPTSLCRASYYRRSGVEDQIPSTKYQVGYDNDLRLFSQVV